MFGFQLGREWKLSIAELCNVFPQANIIYSASGVLILDSITKEEILYSADTIGGTIKIFELELIVSLEDSYEQILDLGLQAEGKFKYSYNLFGEKNIKLENILKKTKNILKNNSVSARYFNKDNGKNLSSAQILGNSILKKGYDFNIVSLGEIFYFGKTIWVQDIDAYSKRDFDKQTDMQIGMLPPKLCQMMINIGKRNSPVTPLDEGGSSQSEQGKLVKTIYDPFVGLGTVLIEALHMGYSEVFGSDLNPQMVETASKNLDDFTERNELDANFAITKLNAKFINESPFFEGIINQIVTEGYLGEIMTKKNISLERIEKQKESLKKLYEAFFENIKKTNFFGTIVMCFPFWDFHGKYVYFNEITEIFKKNNIQVEDIFGDKNLNLTTKTGSLLYKRGSQLVGREIFKLSF